MQIRMFAFLLLLALSGTVGFASPLASPSSQPTTRASPADVLHACLADLDAGDRQKALDCFATADPREAKVAEAQVDMMLAISKLKKAVAAKWGSMAPFDLRMAVVGESECASIKEQINGDTASVEVVSEDDQQAPANYSMVRRRGEWKISLAEEVKAIPNDAAFADQMKAALHLLKIIRETTTAITNGQLNNVEEVQEKLSQSMTP